MEVICAHCTGYRSAQLADSLESILSFSSVRTLFKPGSRVLLKVNCLNPHPPERGVTTHPELVRVLCQLLSDMGGKVSVGDSAGGVSGQSHTAHALEVSGLAGAARAGGADVVNFDASTAVAVPNRRSAGPQPLYIAAPLLDADVIINLPKLKTHLFTGLSAAVKNCYGCLPGAYKHQLHRDYPGLGEFSDVLVDVCLTVAPQLHIMDAVWSMEGNGPAMGTLAHTGVILAAGDPFALDVAASRIAGWPWQSVSTNRAADARQLLPDGGQLKVVGDELVSQLGRPLRRPVSMSIVDRLPPWLVGTVFRWLQPTVVIDGERCTGCHFCLASCPAQAIEMRDGRAHVHRSSCIACYCCVELCQQSAVDLKRRYRAGRDT